jgi:glycosyltransferase involved in cell wall biosynthesis
VLQIPNRLAEQGLSGAGPPKSRCWSVNGRFLDRNPTGVDRYALEILRAIDALIDAKHPLTASVKLEILCSPGAAERLLFTNISSRSLPGAPGHVWEQFILPRYVSNGLLSFCNTGPIVTKKQIVCLHDLNTRLVPQSYSFAFRSAYRILQPLLAKRVARIVTVSQFSQRTIAQAGMVSADEVNVIHNGHEHVLAWNAGRSQLDQTDLPRPFVLLVGSSAPHKNAAVIYSIAAELARKGIYVLITGGVDAKVYARMRNDQVPPNVRHVGRVGDNDLALLYQSALCLVFPSLTEGFGLPALEAMALGCPVISSDVASLAEVCGGAALYAPPHEGSTWLAAIELVAIDSILRDKLIAEGRVRSKHFSWRSSAEKYLALMFDLDHHGERPRCGSRQAGRKDRPVLPEGATPHLEVPERCAS